MTLPAVRTTGRQEMTDKLEMSSDPTPGQSGFRRMLAQGRRSATAGAAQQVSGVLCPRAPQLHKAARCQHKYTRETVPLLSFTCCKNEGMLGCGQGNDRKGPDVRKHSAIYS